MDKDLKSERKSPKQARSRDLVNAIYEATVRILPKIGSYEITTKKIAEMAGVSIGSLYQYFPNKEALLGSVMDISMKASTEKAYKKFDEIQGKTIEESVALIIDFTLDLFLRERERHSEIFRRAPELGRLPSMLQLRNQVVERLAREMESHRQGLDKRDYVRVSFIAVNSVMGVIHTMLYDSHQNYTIEELARELKLMLTTYFTAIAASETTALRLP